jgi:hypothetical protein
VNLNGIESGKGTSLLKNKSFISYWIGYFFSALGDAIYFFTIPWMIKELTGSGTMMGTLSLKLKNFNLRIKPVTANFIERGLM